MNERASERERREAHGPRKRLAMVHYGRLGADRFPQRLVGRAVLADQPRRFVRCALVVSTPARDGPLLRARVRVEVPQGCLGRRPCNFVLFLARCSTVC